MTTKQASTSLILPATVTKFMLMAQEVETLSDGTKTFVYKGFINSETIHLIYLLAEAERPFKSHVVWSGAGDNYDWSIKQNYVPKGGKYYITFVMNDYTHTSKAPKTYAQLDPIMYAKKIHNFQERIDLANDWLWHMCIVDLHTAMNGVGVCNALDHLNGVINQMVAFIETMNKIAR